MNYNPSEHTVAEVTEYVEANPDTAGSVLAAERAGKNRSTLVEHLEERARVEVRVEDTIDVPATTEEGDAAPVDDYPPRPFEEAVAAHEAERLRSLGLAEGEGANFKVNAPASVVPRDIAPG